MLDLRTKRPAIDVKLDGEVKHLPVPLTAAEMAALGKLPQDGPENERAAAFSEWFMGFASRYMGDTVSELGDDGVKALLSAWTEARQEHGEPSMGER